MPLLIAHPRAASSALVRVGSASPRFALPAMVTPGYLARSRSLLAVPVVGPLMLPALRLGASLSLHPLGFRGAPLGAALRHALLQFPQHFAPSASIEATPTPAVEELQRRAA